MEYLLVGVGGFLGANARYILSGIIAQRVGGDFPFATLVVNVTGSLAIGMILGLISERHVTDPAWRQFLVVGFLGGYTTFSSYTFEALALVETGNWLPAVWYILASNVVGLAAAYSGMLLARMLSR